MKNHQANRVRQKKSEKKKLALRIRDTSDDITLLARLLKAFAQRGWDEEELHRLDRLCGAVEVSR